MNSFVYWGSYVALIAALAPLGQSNAQSGHGSSCCSPLTPRIRHGTIRANEGAGQERTQWLRAVVLWRAATRLSEGYPTDSAVLINRAERLARAAAEDARRQFLGGVYSAGYSYAEFDAQQNKLWVLGKEFLLPRRDSMLIVLVDRVDGVGGSPTVVDAVFITATVPQSYWPKIWRSGDTTFSVLPRDTNDSLLTVLRTDPRVAAFIDGEPR